MSHTGKFQNGADVLRALFFVNALEPIRYTPAPTTINAIETASVRHAFNPSAHQSRIFQAKAKILRGTRIRLRSHVKR